MTLGLVLDISLIALFLCGCAWAAHRVALFVIQTIGGLWWR